MKSSQIVMVMSGFPRRSETFALGELIALEARGALAAIFATKPGDGASLHPGGERLQTRVQTLPEGTPQEQAACLVQALKGRAVSGVHGYFAHAPAEVASLVAERLGVPFGFSAHARDARKVAFAELAKRARRAACVIACNEDVAKDMSRSGAPVHLIPHGVDVKQFRAHPLPSPKPLRLLAVGRLVEKKGFHFLIAAAACLKFSFRLRIIGEGPEQERLATMIAVNKLSDRVELCGPRTHAELPEEYAQAHVVVAPSIQDSTGDRDGLPNVILEALASTRAVVASDMGAISSAIKQGETGIMVPPGDLAAIASALKLFAENFWMAEHFGQNGRALVERNYEVSRCTARLHQLLEDVYA